MGTLRNPGRWSPPHWNRRKARVREPLLVDLRREHFESGRPKMRGFDFPHPKKFPEWQRSSATVVEILEVGLCYEEVVARTYLHTRYTVTSSMHIIGVI